MEKENMKSSQPAELDVGCSDRSVAHRRRADSRLPRWLRLERDGRGNSGGAGRGRGCVCGRCGHDVQRGDPLSSATMNANFKALTECGERAAGDDTAQQASITTLQTTLGAPDVEQRTKNPDRLGTAWQRWKPRTARGATHETPGPRRSCSARRIWAAERSTRWFAREISDRPLRDDELWRCSRCRHRA